MIHMPAANCFRSTLFTFQSDAAVHNLFVFFFFFLVLFIHSTILSIARATAGFQCSILRNNFPYVKYNRIHSNGYFLFHSARMGAKCEQMKLIQLDAKLCMVTLYGQWHNVDFVHAVLPLNTLTMLFFFFEIQLKWKTM